MLTPRHGLIGAAAVLMVLAAAAPGAVAATPTPAPGTVAPPVDCGSLEVCVGATSPGRPGDGQQGGHGGGHKPSGGQKGPQCVMDGMSVPCSQPNLGTFYNDCYYKVADPQPAAGEPVWQGHSPGDGLIYETTCPISPAQTQELPLPGGLVWLAQPPAAGAVDPAVLAQRAVDSMRLAGPLIGMEPQRETARTCPPASGLVDRCGTVGVPVWLWTAVTPTTWGPATAAATAGGVTVTAKARVTAIDWDMGDGTTVRCTKPGTPYETHPGALLHSPDCGHVYTQTSVGQPHGTYHVTATSTWSVPWTGGGRAGVLMVTRTSAVDLAVGEVQVLN